MGKLGKWADDQRDYIKLRDGDSMIVEFLGWKIVPNRQDPEKQCIRYTFGIGDQVKTFDSQSTALADLMDEVEEGETVEITRTGKGFDTKYTVERMGEKAPLEKKDLKKAAKKIKKKNPKEDIPY